ncbi:MAG: succinate dehydrogenase/fumarate reductase iron-sulfur subunit [Proteobacteria bacterium]|nr:succinate dehydrogenase/fumarate reductase iron-sulfur subunit [Pseudomonadota bacterium]
MDLTLHVWRQKNSKSDGHMEIVEAKDVSEHSSFLEMLDVVNENLLGQGKEPIAFDHDCREGICGACSLVINGEPHGPEYGTTTCQLHMRSFKSGQHVYIEPWRARALPVLKDLIVDRTSFDRIQQAGGFVSSNTGSPQDANALPIPKPDADKAFDAAVCIGCGACAAACKNASPMLFVAAKVSQLAILPQGKPERERRVLAMVDQMKKEGFGNCTNQYECEAACPKEISVEHIARMNREYFRAAILEEPEKQGHGGD